MIDSLARVVSLVDNKGKTIGNILGIRIAQIASRRDIYDVN